MRLARVFVRCLHHAPGEPDAQDEDFMTRYLGLDFIDADLAGTRAEIATRVDRQAYAYVVTPNVDHVVAYHRSADDGLHRAYDGAAIRICDSRVLAGLAALVGRRLRVCAGSDLTHDLIRDPLRTAPKMAVVGPARAAFDLLARRFPEADLVFVPAGENLLVGSHDWTATVTLAAASEWDILFVCLSFPKQEFFAEDVGKAGRRHGVALCVGASVDFLIGRQARAPLSMQRVGLEWLYRLVHDPRRLWRRYVLHGPTILSLAARQWWSDRRGVPFERVVAGPLRGRLR